MDYQSDVQCSRRHDVTQDMTSEQLEEVIVGLQSDIEALRRQNEEQVVAQSVYQDMILRLVGEKRLLQSNLVSGQSRVEWRDDTYLEQVEQVWKADPQKRVAVLTLAVEEYQEQLVQFKIACSDELSELREHNEQLQEMLEQHEVERNQIRMQLENERQILEETGSELVRMRTANVNLQRRELFMFCQPGTKAAQLSGIPLPEVSDLRMGDLRIQYRCSGCEDTLDKCSCQVS